MTHPLPDDLKGRFFWVLADEAGNLVAESRKFRTAGGALRSAGDARRLNRTARIEDEQGRE